MNIKAKTTFYGCLWISALLVFPACSTAPIQSKSFSPGQEVAVGGAYALPKTLVTVSVDLEYFVLEENVSGEKTQPEQKNKEGGQVSSPADEQKPKPKAAAVFIDLATTENPVKISSAQVPDWDYAFTLRGDEDSLVASKFTVEFEKDGLIKSLNSKSEDRSAEVIANTLGAILKVVSLKSATSSQNLIKGTGIRFTVSQTISAAKIFDAPDELFKSEISSILSGRDARLEKIYQGYPQPKEPKITVSFAKDSTIPQINANSVKKAMSDAKLKREEKAESSAVFRLPEEVGKRGSWSGLFHRIPIPRVLFVNLDQSMVGSATIAVGDSAPIGFIPIAGKRFATVEHSLSFFQNTFGLQKYEKTGSSAAEGGSAAAKNSVDLLKTTLDALAAKEVAADAAAKAKIAADKTALDAAAVASDAAALREVNRQKTLAQKRVHLANLLDQKKSLDAELEKADLPDRTAKKTELYKITEEIAGVEVEIEALQNNKPIS